MTRIFPMLLWVLALSVQAQPGGPRYEALIGAQPAEPARHTANGLLKDSQRAMSELTESAGRAYLALEKSRPSTAIQSATTPTPAKASATAKPQAATPVTAARPPRVTGGDPIYLIECSDGRKRRVLRRSDDSEWFDTHILMGGLGLGHLNIQQLAERLCR